MQLKSGQLETFCENSVLAGQELKIGFWYNM